MALFIILDGARPWSGSCGRRLMGLNADTICTYISMDISILLYVNVVKEGLGLAHNNC